MKQSKIFVIATVFAMVSSACGAKAEPTVNPGDVQSTAMAAAFTVVAQTQAAIPTNTPVPPTDTPVPTPIPTDTPLPLPTTEQVELTLVPTEAQSSGNNNGNECLQPLDIGGAGPGHKTVIKNEIKNVKTITLSLQLYIPNAFGACGVMPADAGTYDLPSGSWYAFAWVSLNNGKNLTTSGSFYVQPAQFDKLTLCIRESGILYAPSC